MVGRRLLYRVLYNKLCRNLTVVRSHDLPFPTVNVLALLREPRHIIFILLFSGFTHAHHVLIAFKPIQFARIQRVEHWPIQWCGNVGRIRFSRRAHWVDWAEASRRHLSFCRRTSLVRRYVRHVKTLFVDRLQVLSGYSVLCGAGQKIFLCRLHRIPLIVTGWDALRTTEWKLRRISLRDEASHIVDLAEPLVESRCCFSGRLPFLPCFTVVHVALLMNNSLIDDDVIGLLASLVQICLFYLLFNYNTLCRTFL